MALWIFDDQNNPVRPARRTERLPNGDYLSPPVAGYVHEPTGYSIQEYTPPAPPPDPVPTPEEQAQADLAEITENFDMFVAMAQTTVKLVKFAADNPTTIQNATEAQILQRYKDEALAILRARKGVS